MRIQQVMRLNTYYPTPISEKCKSADKIGMALWLFSFGSFFALILFVAIYTGTIGVVVLAIVFLLVGLANPIWISDTQKAYVEILDDHILVVDYYCGAKKEREIPLCRIAKAKSTCIPLHGYTGNYCGNRVRPFYLVFSDAKGKYLFKIIDLPETRAVFEKYVSIA